MAKVTTFQLFYPRDFARSVDVESLEIVSGFAVSLRDGGHFGGRVDFQFAPDRIFDPGLFERIRSATCDAPFYDIDEGWQLMVFRKEGWFVVLFGDGESMGTFHTRLRVPADEFIDAWEQLVSPRSSEP